MLAAAARNGSTRVLLSPFFISDGNTGVYHVKDLEIRISASHFARQGHSTNCKDKLAAKISAVENNDALRRGDVTFSARAGKVPRDLSHNFPYQGASDAALFRTKRVLICLFTFLSEMLQLLGREL